MTSTGSAFDLDILAAVAAGGALGASARYLLTLARPETAPLVVLGINVIGCCLMGMLGVLAARGGHRLWKPFLGTGVLGGFTTVSTYALTAHGLLARGEVLLGVAYLLLTPALAVPAAGLGAWVARRGGRRP